MFGTNPIPNGIAAVMVLLITCAGLNPLYARARADDTEEEPRNTEWVLAITAFDISAVSPAHHVVGSLVARTVAARLSRIDYRTIPDSEYVFLRDQAWSRDRAAAARDLVRARGERDRLLFQGHPNWRYRRNVRDIDNRIADLEKRLQEVYESTPEINRAPAFRLTENSLAGIFPPAPREGAEFQFCVNQRIDGFLSGNITEFHGRLIVTMRLYAKFSQSFIYEDFVIFSIEDAQAASDELAINMVAAISGSPLASLTVSAVPENAVILIDGSFVGTGSTNTMDYPVGNIEIESFAEGYQTAGTELILSPGELAEIHINLKPLSRSALVVNADREGALLYRGALFLGETPLETEIPSEQSVFFHAETPDGRIGATIIHADVKDSLYMQTRVPPGQRVERARRAFYGSWARFWIALPTAFILQGLSDAQVREYNITQNPNIIDRALNGYYISMGAWVLFGLVSVEVLIRTGIYIYSAWQEANPVAGTAK